MKLYRVKGSPLVQEYVKIVAENAMGFDVVITKITETSTKEYRDFISRALFEACVRTNYLVEEEDLATGISA